MTTATAATAATAATDCATDAVPERVRFFPRQLIGADDLNQEQTYHRQKLREHNRLLHGWGVVCGCDVQPAPTKDRPWQVRITPGYLLTPQGDAVSVRAEVLFDLATCFVDSFDRCAFARPCPQTSGRRLETSRTVYLAVRYTECETHPVHVSPAGCSCDEADCQYSRVLDAYELSCLTELPKTHEPAGQDCDELMSSRVTECLTCPDDPWVVLAQLDLPESKSATVAKIDTLVHRRILLSAATLGEMVMCLNR